VSPVAGASTRPAAPSAQGVTRSVPALEPSGDEGSVPDVSVTIVTYQCKDLVLTCLESLTDGARASQLEVIIVDNGSTDGVVEAVKDRYPDLRVIEVGGNDGFGRSHNLAASHATGRYLLVLNPDTFVEPGAIDTLVRFADERERLGHPVGMVAPRLLNPDGTDQRTARAFPTASAGLFGRRSPLTRAFPRNRWSRRFLVSDRTEDDEPWVVDWVSGAAMLIPRAEFDELGGFDRDFFMHFEDAELCHRIGASGREVWCVPRSEIVHAEGGCRDGWSPAQLWHFHRGAYLFARKARYPKLSDPRRWGIATLLGIRFLGALGLRLLRSAPKNTTNQKEVEPRA